MLPTLAQLFGISVGELAAIYGVTAKKEIEPPAEHP
jgi:hypothetical protein